jgi:GT2 family glycosyltransferase
MEDETVGPAASADASVVIPTIGRPEQLRTTLESLVSCTPPPGEIIVVDQSDGSEVIATVADFAAAGVVRVASAGRGIGLAVNEGLRQASYDVVLGTHDDCSVADDWVAVGCRLAAAAPGCMITGRVLPLGDPESIPSTKDDPTPRDFTGQIRCDVLYPANVILPRVEVLAFGGFDERFETAAEDNDLCYRWLRAGRSLRYDPSLVVWHRDWRAPEELRRLHVRYWREQGRFYAKHLRARDAQMLRFLLTDLRYVVGSLRWVPIAAIRRRRPLITNDLRGLLVGLVPGLVSGWRDFRAGEAAGP